MNLAEFIVSDYRNAWVVEPGLEYYVRKSILFPGVIELANCSASPDSREFGYWRFLKRYASEVPFIAEQVLNRDLVKLYERLGWRRYDVAGTPQFASPVAVRLCQGQLRFAKRFG